MDDKIAVPILEPLDRADVIDVFERGTDVVTPLGKLFCVLPQFFDDPGKVRTIGPELMTRPGWAGLADLLTI